MSACPFHQKVRPELPPLTDRIATLPVDDRGYPIPFFVDYLDGKPEFRAMDGRKWVRCVKERLCWVCGQKLGKHLAFLIGPMCALNRTTSEPPSHLECAQWSAKACPFLTRPNMVRREDELTEELEKNVAGVAIKRNPGAMAIWVTQNYSTFSDGRGGRLIQIGDPEQVTWWREGRQATRAEVLHSIDTGMPSLIDACQMESVDEVPAALAELDARYVSALKLLPA